MGIKYFAIAGLIGVGVGLFLSLETAIFHWTCRSCWVSLTGLINFVPLRVTDTLFGVTGDTTTQYIIISCIFWFILYLTGSFILYPFLFPMSDDNKGAKKPDRKSTFPFF